MSDQELTIRMAKPEDGPSLRRLAALDSARPLRGRVLLAEADGVPVAAISLEGGTVTADPFEHTADTVRLLMVRRYQLLRRGEVEPSPRPLLLRLVPQAAG